MRMNKKERCSLIIATGVRVANRDGLTAATRHQIARESSVPVTVANIRWHYPKQRDLWAAIVAHGRDIAPHVYDQARDLGLTPPAV